LVYLDERQSSGSSSVTSAAGPDRRQLGAAQSDLEHALAALLFVAAAAAASCLRFSSRLLGPVQGSR